MIMLSIKNENKTSKNLQFRNFCPKVLNENCLVATSSDETLSIELHADHVTFVRTGKKLTWHFYSFTKTGVFNLKG